MSAENSTVRGREHDPWTCGQCADGTCGEQRRLRVLDLFSGLEGWSAPFRNRGHDVVTLDIDPKFGADYQVDFLSVDSLHDLDGGEAFTGILASPPCDTMSTGSFRHHWMALAECARCDDPTMMMLRLPGEQWDHPPNHEPQPLKPYDFYPKTEAAKTAKELLDHTWLLISNYAHHKPFWIIENPRAMMRNFMPVENRRTVTWCQYGDTVMKPTDLWGGFPPSLQLKPPCKNGDPCHEAAPRGAKTGTQGKKGAAARGKIPYDLALAVCLAAERDLT